MTNIEELTTMFSQVKDSYMFYRLTGKAHASIASHEPMKFNGCMMMLMRGGTPFNIRVNDRVYNLKPNTLLSVNNGDVITASDDMPTDFEAYVLFFNLSFLRNVNINITAINLPSLFQKPQSAIELSDNESDSLLRYFDILHHSALENDIKHHFCHDLPNGSILSTPYWPNHRHPRQRYRPFYSTSSRICA